jgi:hypothetical protein
LIGQVTRDFTFDRPLTNSDPQIFKTGGLYIELSEEQGAIGSASCKIIKADFMGHREWHPGMRWPEQLQAIPPLRRSTDEDGQNN